VLVRALFCFVSAALMLVACDPIAGFPQAPGDPPDKPEEPAERPEEPAERPEDPAERPTERPTERPEEPTERPEEPAERPEEPAERPEEPAERPEEPAERPEEPAERPEEPAERPSEPGTQPQEPTDPPEEPEEPTEPPEEPEEPTEPPNEPEEPAEPPPPPYTAWATDLAIADVLLFQGSSVALTPTGPTPLAATDVPVVAGREALLRVMLQPDARWAARPVQVEVVLESSNGSSTYSLEVTPYAASTIDDLASSANFSLPGDLITPDATLTVSLIEALASRAGSSEPGAARFPNQGAAPLQAIENGGIVEVWFVPLVYSPDGSDRAPDTSAEQIELLRSTLERQYPVSDVLVDILAPVPLEQPMLSDGDGWTDALYQVSNLRQALAVPDDVYLYGLVQPAADFSSYCPSGCVTGLSWVGLNPSSAWTRSSLGLGFTGDRFADTFAHEVGHAHGRQHSPCGGPANPDPDYPNGGGRLGTWGWDAVDADLIDPEAYGDLMGYCRPRWVSDYTYAALSARIDQVHSMSFVGALPGWPRSFSVLEVSSAGVPSMRSSLTLDRPPEGKTVELEILDERGRVLETVIGTVLPFEHLGSAAVLFEPGAGASVRYDGVTLPI
jgi:hypothetical protein